MDGSVTPDTRIRDLPSGTFGVHHVRVSNCLQSGGTKTIDWPDNPTLREVASYTRAELLSIPNFGRKCLIEVERVLASVGIRPGGNNNGVEVEPQAKEPTVLDRVADPLNRIAAALERIADVLERGSRPA